MRARHWHSALALRTRPPHSPSALAFDSPPSHPLGLRLRTRPPHLPSALALRTRHIKPFRPDSPQAGSILNASSPKGFPSMRSGWNSAWGYQGSTLIGVRALRSPYSLFIGYRTEMARRFSAGTCPPRPDITAAHCCHLCGHLPASPRYYRCALLPSLRASARIAQILPLRTVAISAGTCPHRPDIS